MTATKDELIAALEQLVATFGSTQTDSEIRRRMRDAPTLAPRMQAILDARAVLRRARGEQP